MKKILKQELVITYDPFFGGKLKYVCYTTQKDEWGNDVVLREYKYKRKPTKRFDVVCETESGVGKPVRKLSRHYAF
jgi:hypothetical protein